ncbi:MAG: dienelactone hydrolase family protein [Caulobacteraceae bacterium]
MISLHYVAFASLHETPLVIAGRLRVPEGEGKLPAVIILHGSAGPTEREGGYAGPLNQAGFVTLEPDQWSPRGLAGGADGRPPSVVETLADLYGARAWLAGRSEVDPARIGVMGFSFGGVACMLAATRARNHPFLGGDRFAAIMPVYPVCYLYNSIPGFELGDLVDAPMLLITAELDSYDNDPGAGPALVASLSPADRRRIRIEVMESVCHGFDMPGPMRQVEDPAGNRGAGGLVAMAYNAEAAQRSHALAVDFFSAALNRGRSG